LRSSPSCNETDDVENPEVRYAWNGDISLAYQVFGEGRVDVVYLQGYCSHLDLSWESPFLARFLRGLGSRSRVIATDRRGWGLSDRFSPDAVPPLEIVVDDILQVMDAAGSERAVVFGSWDCGILAMLLAAMHPQRVAGLVLCDTFPTFVATEDTPSMATPSQWEEIDRTLHDGWGRDFDDDAWGGPPSQRDPREREWFNRYARASVPPGALIAESRRLVELDARPVLHSIHAPTLVVGFERGRGPVDPSIARLIADRVPNARLAQIGVEGDPADTGWWHWYGRGDAILREIGQLLDEVQKQDQVFNRVLATVLFTDIVDSTTQAVRLGDRSWKDVVERHHQIVRELLAAYRGTEVDTAGDGFFATFDGPARAAACAKAIVTAVRPLGIEVRAGVHTGEVETIAGKTGGVAVVIGARIGAAAGPSEVLASRTVRDLVAGSGLVFEDTGEHELKGVSDRWHLYRLLA
jgi:class 3 adenylate cyclase/alpha-beta hydrolase superfamily lysophospholipase